MRKLKKIAAMTLAVTMAAGSSFAAFAEDPASGSLSGTGKVEGTVDTDVLKVVLPTEVSDDTTYDFILDPEGLIKATAHEKYGADVDFGEGTLFFKNEEKKYSNVSNTKKVINKSSVAADIMLTATINVGENVKLNINDDPVFTDDTSASIYMALTDGADLTGAADEKGVATLVKTMEPTPDTYEITYDSGTGAYAYTLKDGATGFEEFDFSLTGACNAGGDWSELADIAPTVEVVWTFAKHTDKVNVLTSDGTGDVVVYYEGEQPTGLKLIPVTITGTNKAAINLSAPDQITITDEKVTLKASFLAAMIAAAGRGTGTYKLTINGTDYTVTLTK